MSAPTRPFIDSAQHRWSSTSREKRQSSSKTHDRPSEAELRQRSQKPQAGSRDARIRPPGELVAPLSIISAREPYGKVTTNFDPCPSSSSTPFCEPLAGRSTRPAGGVKHYIAATSGPPPPDPSAAIECSVYSFGTKPHVRLAGMPSRSYAAGGPSESSPSRSQAAGGPSTSSPSRSQSPAGPSAVSPARPDAGAGPSKPLSAAGPDRAATRKIRISIRTEFYLAARNRAQYSSDWEEFMRILAYNYNQLVGRAHPRIQSSLLEMQHINDQKWHLGLQGFHEDTEENQTWCKPFPIANRGTWSMFF